MTWRDINNITAVFAVLAVAGAGVAFGATVLDDEEADRGAVTPASREPLRKAPLLRNAQEPPEKDDTNAQDPEAEEARAVQLGFDEPAEFRVGTPERALASFMEAWRDRRWSVMETWTAAESGPDARRSALRRRFGPFRLRGWRIVRREAAAPPAAFDYKLEIAYRTLLDPVLRRSAYDLRLARRTADGDASRRKGSWGVDPVPRLMAAMPIETSAEADEPFSVRHLLENGERYVQDEVTVKGVVQEDEVLERDVPGTTVLGEGTADHLLVVAQDARELPAIEDGAEIRVRGEMRILWVDDGEDGFVSPGPVLERFRNDPYLLAEDVDVLEHP